MIPAPAPPTHRVRKLHLRTHAAEAAHHFAVLFEDALRTSSLPDANGGRLVVLRRLDLGILAATLSPSAIALTLETQYRSLVRHAIHASDPNADRAPAVFFADATEAAILLGRRLVHGPPAIEWYWRSALPGYHPTDSPSASWRLIRRHLASLPAASSALAEWVQAMRNTGSATEFLESLQPDEAHDFLASFPPLPRHTRPRPATATALPPQPSSTTLHARSPDPRPFRLSDADLAFAQPWIQRWTAEDPRSVWLIVLLVLARNPSQVAHPALLAAIDLTLQILEADPRPMSPSPVPPPQRPTSPRFGPRQHDAPPSIPESPITSRTDREPFPSGTESDSSTEVREISPEHSRPPSSQTPSNPSLDSKRPPQSINPVPIDKPAGAKRKPETRCESTQHAIEESHGPRANANAAASESSALSPAGPPTTAILRQSHDPAEAGAVEPMAEPAPEGFPDGQPTAFAGLAFVIPVLRQLSLPSFLEAHPWLLDENFPARLLRRIGSRVGMTPTDPWETALGLPPRSQADASSPDDPQDNASEVNDPSHQPDPIVLPAIVVDLLCGRLESLRHAVSREALLEAWQAAIRCWCRRRAGLGLVNLVRRSGWIRSTRTHIDVALPLHGVDLRIRRNGLDLDSGWVPWLGKVVSIHYLESP